MMSLQNLFVAKLPRNLTDADLQHIFAEYNPTSAKVMLDATTGKSKGFGFVLFDSEAAGLQAYEAVNKTHVTLHGHSFNLCIFPSKHDGKVASAASNALYIRNIPRTLCQMEVEQFLRGFGTLTYCAMREDHHGSPVWVVYAEYETVQDAKHALTSIHGTRTHFNYHVAILAKFADSEEAKKERRRRRVQQTHGQQPSAGPLGETGESFGGRGSPLPAAVNSSHPGAYAVPQVYPPVPPESPSSLTPRSGRANDGLRAAASAESISPFLHANFPGGAGMSGTSCPHFGQQERSSNGRGTPLNISFGTDWNAEAPAFPCPQGGLLTPVGPARRSHSTGAGGTYRHNPYTPLTPLSSATSSVEPSTPVGLPKSASCASLHFGCGHHFSHNLHNGYNGTFGGSHGYATSFASMHYASTKCNGFLAPPVNEY